MSTALAVDNLGTGYGRIEVLRSVSLTVAQGEVVALVGANGAGKSTLLNTLIGAVRPWSGSIALDGVEITGFQPEAVVPRGLALVPERRQLFGDMTTEENLLIGAHCLPGGRRAAARELARQYELFPILSERRRQRAQSLSGGEQQMLAIARARMVCPKMLMLDEPSLGLAPIMVERIMRLICDLRAHGTTILLVEQNARAALGIADRAYVLETGRIVAAGAAAVLAQDPNIADAYLGGADGSLETRIRERARRMEPAHVRAERAPSPGQ